MIENGKKVKMNYRLTVDGEVVDTTEGRDPFEYTHGKDQIIPGLQSHLIGLNEGDERDFVVGPEDAFGVIDPKAYAEVPKSRLPEEAIEEGAQLQVSEPDGRLFL